MSDGEIIDPLEQEDWDFETNSAYIDEIGEDFRGMDEESCKCLFLDQLCPSPVSALAEDKKVLGFDFYAIRASLHLDFHQCILLINFIRQTVSEHKSIIDGTQFNTNEELLAYMTEKDQFHAITLDLPFWKDEKYLKPFDQNDTLLCGFDWEEEDELNEDEREKILADARIEAEVAMHFATRLKSLHGVDLKDLK